jgi:hypothetical protein
MPTVPTTTATRLRTQRQRFSMHTMIQGIGVLALGWALAGCSVGMAMSGTAEPNLGAFGVGSSRGQVEGQRGRAMALSTDANGGRTETEECGPGSMGD